MLCASGCIARVGETSGGGVGRAGVCAGAASGGGAAIGGVGWGAVCAELGLYGCWLGFEDGAGGVVNYRTEYGGQEYVSADGCVAGGDGADGVFCSC